jgi:hypothetical protein
MNFHFKYHKVLPMSSSSTRYWQNPVFMVDLFFILNKVRIPKP